jgi:hypothetical protein
MDSSTHDTLLFLKTGALMPGQANFVEAIMKLVTAAVLSVLALGSVGCSSSRMVDSGPAVAPQPTSGIVRGVAMYQGAGGQSVVAANEDVTLVPTTPYAEQRFAKLYQGRRIVLVSAAPKLEAPPAEYTSAIRRTKADATGQFNFSDIPAGTYFVTTRVTIPGSGPAAIYTNVSVPSQGATRVALSGN